MIHSNAVFAFISPCASATRGHVAINSRVQEAISQAGGHTLSPLALNVSSDTTRRVAAARATLRSAAPGVPLIGIVDFPDLPPRPELKDLLSLCDHTVQLNMVVSAQYRTVMERAKDRFIADTTVAIELGACRTIVEPSGTAKCTPSDYRTPPLIQNIPPIVTVDHDIWDEACDWARARSGLGSSHPVYYWQKSGFPDESERLENVLQTTIVRRGEASIVSSSMLERVARRRLISDDTVRASGVVRFASLANRVIASPGYSTFWELYALGILDDLSRVRLWCQLDRPIEGIKARLALTEKVTLINRSAAVRLRSNNSAGVYELGRVLQHSVTVHASRQLSVAEPDPVLIQQPEELQDEPS